MNISLRQSCYIPDEMLPAEFEWEQKQGQKRSYMMESLQEGQPPRFLFQNAHDLIYRSRLK